MKEVRVRYAPSPTGHLHIGNARTALYVYLFAQKYEGKMVIRIEDTDTARNVAGGEASQIHYLNWLGIEWDEGPDKPGKYGPYRQLERLPIYEQSTAELLEEGLAYKCFCSEEELAREKEAQMADGIVATRYSGKCRHLSAEQIAAHEAAGTPHTVRFAVPTGVTYTWSDLVRKDISFSSDDIGDWVIVKNNGIPTYNYACAIDDHLMAISDVLRGEDHISNTPKQLMIYEAFGWEPPHFGHMSIIVNDEHKKLSKRDESVMQFIEQYESEGYLPEAMFNFIALLGFSPAGEEEILSKEALSAAFDITRLHTAPAVFDKQKLEWVNNRYVKAAPLARIVDLARPHLERAYDLSTKSEQWINDLIALFHNQMSYGAEIVPLAEMFFTETMELDAEASAFMSSDTSISETITVFAEQLAALTDFNAENIQAAIKATGKLTGAKGKLLFMPIRIATTGMMHGPELPATIALLGQEKVNERLRAIK
jgi:nondiscriminating glutamyl-tRNA synthetase